MKKQISTFIFSVTSFMTFSQLPPTGVNSPPANNTNAQANAAWYRGGNTQSNSYNTFGTLWNSPIYTQTNGVNRTKLNGTFNATYPQYPINGYTSGVNTSGYMLIGADNNSITSGNSIYQNKGAFSMLHLNGATPSNGFQEYGYRPWMKTGVTFTDNRDLTYFGLRKIGNLEDYTETVIQWSDNSGNIQDEMAFRFSGAGAGSTTIDNNIFNSNDLDGLHVARYTANGRYGLGNTFGHVNVPGHANIYTSPQSLFHMSYEWRNGVANDAYGYMQVTYRDNAGVLGSGETADDGLRIGIDNALQNGGGIPYLNGVLRWQENTPFVIQTDWNNTVGGTSIGERMRISTTGAPGVPATLLGLINTTRVSINYHGQAPITQPKALLHLGTNTTIVANWMDYGMLSANGAQTMFVGITPNNYSDANKAVIGFSKSHLLFMHGSNGEYARFDESSKNFGIGNYGPNGVILSAPTERLDVEGNGRFRNVPAQAGQSLILGLQQGANPNDVELSRLAFSGNTNEVLLGNGTWGTVQSNGLACWDLNGNGVQDPAEDINFDGLWNALDCKGIQGNPGTNGTNGVNGTNGTNGTNGRNCWDLNGNGINDPIEDINFDGLWNSLDCKGPQGVQGIQGVQGLQGIPGSSTGAHNGTSMSTIDPTKVAFGQNVGQALNPGQLLSDREIPMNNNSIFFTDNNAISNGENRLGIGTVNPLARVHVKVNTVIQENFPTGMFIENTQLSSSGTAQGLEIVVTGANSGANYGQRITASNANSNVGLNVNSNGGATNNGVVGNSANGTTQNFGVSGTAISFNAAAVNNTGVQGLAHYGNLNFGGSFGGQGNPNGTSTNTYGIRTIASGPGLNNYGIYSTAYGATNNYAGYFYGNVEIAGGTLVVNGGTVTGSDQQFKTNVQNISGAMSLINQLQPRTYNFDLTNYADFGFEADQQMGLIAQEVETVIPTIVSNHIHPAKFDSLGIEISPEISYKGVEYEELIPLLIAGMKEQQTVISSKDSMINNLNDRLTQLENCLSGILPMLCQMSQSVVQPTSEEVQQKLKAAIDVKLSDKNAIILNQNVPNPFAESTVISYSIPASVQRAQVHFYDGTGKLINSVEITERGSGQLNVFADDLTTGVYSYSLVADGQIVSTKRMVKQ